MSGSGWPSPVTSVGLTSVGALTTDREDVTDGRIRGSPPAPARRGDADPRLARRGRRRAPGGVDPVRARRHERRGEHRRVADDGRLARVPVDARRPQAPPRGRARGGPAARPDRHARRTTPRRTRRARRWPPTRSAPRCSSCSRRCSRPSAWRSCSTTCSRVPFEDIALIVDRSPAAARQLASRARRRVRGADRDAATADRRVVDAFVAAARGGDFERSARAARPRRRPARRRRQRRAADHRGRPRGGGRRAVLLATRDGAPGDRRRAPGFVATEDGVPVAVLAFTVVDGRITAIDALGARPGSPGWASRRSSGSKR